MYIKTATRWLLGALLVGAGINHFLNTGFYVDMMPPYLPWHRALVYVSGVAEIAIGAALCIPRLASFAAWGAILLFIAVFPANVYMAMNAELFPTMSPTFLWARLPVQPLLILWAYWYTETRVIRPLRSSRAGDRG